MNNRHLIAVLAGALSMSGARLVIGSPRVPEKPRDPPAETKHETRQLRRAAERRARKLAKQAVQRPRR